MNQSPHDSIAAYGGSYPRPFDYESYALTNCAIPALSGFMASPNQRMHNPQKTLIGLCTSLNVTSTSANITRSQRDGYRDYAIKDILVKFVKVKFYESKNEPEGEKPMGLN